LMMTCWEDNHRRRCCQYYWGNIDHQVEPLSQ
jgi:hypothetical protein